MRELDHKKESSHRALMFSRTAASGEDFESPRLAREIDYSLILEGDQPWVFLRKDDIGAEINTYIISQELTTEDFDGLEDWGSREGGLL